SPLAAVVAPGPSVARGSNDSGAPSVPVAPVAPGQETDLDRFMERVLAKRDENWKKLQQYLLDEQARCPRTGRAAPPASFREAPSSAPRSKWMASRSPRRTAPARRPSGSNAKRRARSAPR